jgi:CcmD family protein
VTAAEKYTAAAYLVVFLGVLAYVLIMAAKLQRLEREVTKILELARARDEALARAAAGGGGRNGG